MFGVGSCSASFVPDLLVYFPCCCNILSFAKPGWRAGGASSPFPLSRGSRPPHFHDAPVGSSFRSESPAPDLPRARPAALECEDIHGKRTRSFPTGVMANIPTLWTACANASRLLAQCRMPTCSLTLIPLPSRSESWQAWSLSRFLHGHTTCGRSHARVRRHQIQRCAAICAVAIRVQFHARLGSRG